MDENLQNLIQQSDEHFLHHQDILSRKLALEPDADLQVKIEDVYLHRMAAQATGPVERYNALDREYRALLLQRDLAAKVYDHELAAAEKTVRDDNAPFIIKFKRWGQTMQEIKPKDTVLAGYVQGSCREIEGMILRPLREILEAIQKHQQKIESWINKD